MTTDHTGRQMPHRYFCPPCVSRGAGRNWVRLGRQAPFNNRRMRLAMVDFEVHGLSRLKDFLAETGMVLMPIGRAGREKVFRLGAGTRVGLLLIVTAGQPQNPRARKPRPLGDDEILWLAA